MTSERRTASNKRNAQKSRGPRTEVGKAHSSKNALRHGLSVSVVEDPKVSADIERLAAAIEEEETLLAPARTIAAAVLDLHRIESAKVSLLNANLDSAAATINGNPDKADSQGSPEQIQGNIAETLGSALIETLPQLASFQRYEKRAQSRLKRGVQALRALKGK